MKGGPLNLLDSLLPRASFSSDQTFDFSRLNPLINSLELIGKPKTHLQATLDCLSCHSTPTIKSDLPDNHLSVTAMAIQLLVSA